MIDPMLTAALLHILIAHGPGSCTRVPSLYSNWKALTAWPNEPDSALRDHLVPYRGSVTFDPFDAVISGDSAARAKLQERVLWEDDSVIVIVAKHSTPHDVLVLPKREMMFPVDASAKLLGRMATVAAAVSDAFIESVGKRCDASLASTIEISSPDGIGVRHLHVHVRPPQTFSIQDDNSFYATMRRVLLSKLREM